MMGKDFNDREQLLLNIRDWCQLYLEGDCADAIALENIKKVITTEKVKKI